MNKDENNGQNGVVKMKIKKILSLHYRQIYHRERIKVDFFVCCQKVMRLIFDCLIEKKLIKFIDLILIKN